MRRLLLKSMAAGLAGGLSGLWQVALAAEPSTIRRGIRELRGTAFVNGRPAQLGMAVRPGDTVTTEGDGEVVYVVGRDAYMQSANTRVQFAAGGVTSLRVLTGALTAVFGRGVKTITTPVATAGIRGTGCYIEVEPRRTYFCLCYGSVALRPRGGDARRYTTRHHESPYWVEKGRLTRAPMINHEDATLVMLENLVGRQPPFVTPSRR